MPTTIQQPGAPRRRLRVLTAGLGLLLLAGAAGCTAPDQPDQGTSTQSATDTTPGPIDGVQLYEDLSREHATTEVTYDQSPAVGGAPSPVWTNCGIYTAPVEEMRAVHSMEHGAVWLTYRPDLPAGPSGRRDPETHRVGLVEKLRGWQKSGVFSLTGQPNHEVLVLPSRVFNSAPRSPSLGH